ncbi:hypothetical protein GGR57DRAFT_413269 [Xylariaceae sp. FL1272]|nr:hypothetical protein GGR57DRAFT_413269 [Xylariaceae sp. FL1272]
MSVPNDAPLVQTLLDQDITVLALTTLCLYLSRSSRASIGLFNRDGLRLPQHCPQLQQVRDHISDPLQYRPERWLPAEHDLFEQKYANDDVEAFNQFSHGPRTYAGREIVWWQARLIMAKVLWSFDLEMIPDQDVNLEDLKCWGYWIKPELRVWFIQVMNDKLDVDG